MCKGFLLSFEALAHQMMSKVCQILYPPNLPVVRLLSRHHVKNRNRVSRVINHFLSVEPQLSREKGNKRKSRKEMEDVAVEALALIKGGCWGFQNSSLGLG